jgi:hypothetical protein
MSEDHNTKHSKKLSEVINPAKSNIYISDNSNG